MSKKKSSKAITADMKYQMRSFDSTFEQFRMAAQSEARNVIRFVDPGWCNGIPCVASGLILGGLLQFGLIPSGIRY